MRMLYFAVLLAAFCHAQAEVNHKTLVSSHNHDNTLVNHGFGNETARCSWNCTVVDSDLSEEMKTTIAKRNLIRLVVKYEKKVDDQCVNQTSRNSSGNTTEHWQIWLANKQLSSFEKATEILMNLMFCTDTNEEHKEIRAMCVFKPVRTTATTKIYNSWIQFPLFSRGHLADLGSEFNITDCNTEGMDNSQPCLNISKSTGNSSSTNLKSPFERGGWPVAVLFCLCFVFLFVFMYYSPAFLCLFSPTEVTEDGVRQTILEGASPVSFRSLVGNYFFSGDDGTIWHKAKTFISRVVVMPVPFFGPVAIFIDFQFFSKIQQIQFLRRIIIACYSCYCIRAFCISFFKARSFKAKPCFVCKFVKPKILTCQDELPRQIINHLRVQPLILVECWRLFTHYLLSYFKMSLIVLPSFKFSIDYLLRFSIFMVLLCTIPAVSVILLIAILFVAFNCILYTSPVSTSCNVPNRMIQLPHFIPKFIVLAIRVGITIVNLPATLGAAFVLLFACICTLIALVIAFALLFSEKGLPYVACFVLVLYYVWSSYSSFTNKYQDLALSLFKHCKKSRRDKFTDMALNTDQEQENTSNVAERRVSEDGVMKIPKELFHMACEELMPIREGVCILILKIIIIVCFVFLVFSLIMLMNVGATPVMKALLTFLTGSFPKIVDIYVDGSRQKKLGTMATDEKIPKILQEYINRTAESNQAHENCGGNVDEVIPLVNADEVSVNIELVNI